MMPYQEFLNLVDEMMEHENFWWWMSNDCFGVESSNIHLLVLDFLRYIGRNWTFDNLEEATASYRENHRQFFHVMIDYGSLEFYKQHVTDTPKKYILRAPRIRLVSIESFNIIILRLSFILHVGN